MTKTIKVYHTGSPSDASKVHVANVTVTGQVSERILEVAYGHTQNIMGSWSRKDGNPDDYDFVEVVAPLPVHNGRVYGLRSTDVGDLLEVEGRTFRVMSFGFEEVL